MLSLCVYFVVWCASLSSLHLFLAFNFLAVNGFESHCICCFHCCCVATTAIEISSYKLKLQSDNLVMFLYPVCVCVQFCCCCYFISCEHIVCVCVFPESLALISCEFTVYSSNTSKKIAFCHHSLFSSHVIDSFVVPFTLNLMLQTQREREKRHTEREREHFLRRY